MGNGFAAPAVVKRQSGKPEFGLGGAFG